MNIITVSLRLNNPNAMLHLTLDQGVTFACRRFMTEEHARAARLGASEVGNVLGAALACQAYALARTQPMGRA